MYIVWVSNDYKYYVLISTYFDCIEGANEGVLYSWEKNYITQNKSSVVDSILANDEEGEYTLQIRYPTIPTQTHCYTKVYSVYCLGVKVIINIKIKRSKFCFRLHLL